MLVTFLSADDSIEVTTRNEIEVQVLVWIEPSMAGVADRDQVLVRGEAVWLKRPDVVNDENDVFIE
jgi:hypothetical protein